MQAQATKKAKPAAHSDRAAPAAALTVTPIPTSEVFLQRQSCACGGACPRCQGTSEPPPAPQPIFLKAELAVGATDDPLEREADRIADEVTTASAPHAVGGAPPRIQRLSRRPSGRMEAAPASVAQTISNPGRPLEPALRHDMEQRFGHDFRRVRVHTDAAAERSAREVNAHAYTVGHNVVFGERRFAPATEEGRRLLAHELTHVVQQSRAADGIAVQRDARQGAVEAPELDPGWEKALLEIMSQKEDPEFMVIEIQGELLNAEPEVFAALYARLSPSPPPAKDKLAVKFRSTFRGEIRKRLLRRFKDVGRHYKPVDEVVGIEVPELSPGWEKALIERMSGHEDPELLAIELEGDLLNAEPEVFAALHARLSKKRPSNKDKLAVTFNKTFKGEARERLLRRFKDVGQHYKPLGSDPYAHLGPGVAPGRKTQDVHELGRIDAPRGVRLRSRPGTKDDDVILPFDTLVVIDRKTIEKEGQQSWFYVVALGDDDAGRNVTGVGFVEEYFVARKPPEPTAHLYLVKRGDMLKDIAAKYYKHGFTWGHDARVYVQAIYHANKERDVVFRQNPDLTVDRRALKTESLSEALELWREARVVEGQALWVPSGEFVRRLKAAGVIHHASISKELWDATIGAIMALIDWAQYTAGFIIGLLQGAWNAISDLFSGVVDLIKALWSVVKAIFGDWDDIKEFAKKLATLWEKKGEILEAIATDFTNKWESPDDYDRGNFQGEVLGYIMMTAFITLVTLGGGAVIAGAGRLGAFMKLIQVVDKAGDITSYAGKLSRAASLPAKVVDKARDSLKGRVAKAVTPETPSAPGKPEVEVPRGREVEGGAPETIEKPKAAEKPETVEKPEPTVKRPSEPFDMKQIGADTGTPQVLSTADFGKVKLKAGQDALYILRDAEGTVLKVGKTSAAAAKNRLSVYKRAGALTNKELQIEVHPLNPSSRNAEFYEKALRAKMESAGHAMPWDNTGGRLGRSGFGTPGEGVRAPPVTKGEMADLLKEHKGNLREVAKELGVHRRTVDLWAKALGLTPKDFK